MKHKLTLTANAWGGMRDARIVWDDESGGIVGVNAKQVVFALEMARQQGSVETLSPNRMEISDPYHDQKQLCAVLSRYWDLPDSWHEHMPGVEGDETPDGAVN